MANYIICLCLQRIALPICLILSIIFRPCLLSAFYLILLFYLPFVPVPTTRTMSGHTECYLKVVLIISFITSISQLTFQLVLLSMPPYAHFLKNCQFIEQILRHVGLVRLDGMQVREVVQWLSPEVVMLFSSVLIYSLINKFTKRTFEGSTSEQGDVQQPKPKKKRYAIITVIGRYISLAGLCLAGILRPSIPGGIYFLVFLGGATWWSCCKKLRKIYAFVCRFVMVLLFLHVSVLYGYQFQWPQEYLSGNSTYARYFGLTPIISVKCDEPRVIIFNDAEWATYLNPICLIFVYYILALESKLLLIPQTQKKSGTFSRLEGSFNGPLQRQMSQRLSNRRLVRSGTTHHRWQTATRKVRVLKLPRFPSEKTPLIRGVSPSRKYGVTHAKSPSSILQDSTGSVTITGDGHDDIPMQQLGTAEEELQASLFENIVFGMASIFQVLVRTSYIATNITMMAWSITYHSWLTFVLLIWANLLWLLPNQRRAMLRSSPFLVIYAQFLLISAYIYSMDLTEDELPSKIQNINLAQIGFQKITVLPCKQLFVKCLYTTMFWVTLRQFMHERQEARQTSALADMVAPLQVTVGTATQAISREPHQQESKGNQIMKKIGDFISKLLTKLWIWLVAIMLFVVAITGERMTGFRIIYMFLFLFFILTFQLSFNLWRRVMFGFWLTVIGYSMLTLVLVYTYQFDHFPDYWKDYLHIPVEQQRDIGLEIYETKQLFVRLFTPTMFVVVTAIQVHYFHKDFLEIYGTKSRHTSIARTDSEQHQRTRSDGSSVQGFPWDPDSEDKTESESIQKPSLFTMKNIKTKKHWIILGKYWYRKLKKMYSYTWLYLELHMFKVVMLTSMLLCIYDVCAIHMLILLLTVLALTLGQPAQNFSMHFNSILISILLLAKMIYQIQYIHHNTWDVNCDNSTTNTTSSNTTYNNAEWFGFQKINQSAIPLAWYVRWYIGFIFVVMLRAITVIRQRHERISQGRMSMRPYLMFQKITRTDADKNVAKCIKYFFNFGFYKFGIEVCLIATVALIGTRMDLYAVFYGIWLTVMFSMERKQLEKIWNCYLCFIAILLPIQYLMVVGLPPGLCIIYPWDISELLRRVQDWMYLLDSELEYRPSSKKLLCDIFLLILVSRQAVIFRIENRWAREHPDTEYPGGSNDSILHHAEEPGFINPVPDFVTYVRSWLDIFKRGILQSLMWITLAIVFLAGTNRVNLFSIGYLIGSFIFLWQGSDLYLKPIPSILKSWNGLLGYNVGVIMIKTILQIIGCIFIKEVETYACWFIQLLGIGCIQKFDTAIRDNLTEAECNVPREDVGLAWDGVCFAFLILQRRLFKSYNFFHIIDETKATTILASRGAELIEDLRERQMSLKAEQEGKILEKIKQKMDRIKANQQKIQGPSYQDATNHFVEEAPMARSPSLTSCASATSTSHTPPAGYHTPIDEEDPPPFTPRANSLVQTQAPTPCSALMTVSLDAYLEPQRISFSSPPNSELIPRAPSLDESFPVFSPPPYESTVTQRPTHQRQTSIGPPWMQGSFITPRQSIISYSSRSPLSHHTYKIYPGYRPLYRKYPPSTNRQAIRSGDYYMFDDLDDEEELEFITEKDLGDTDDLSDDMEPKKVHTTAAGNVATVGELLDTVMKTNVETALHQGRTEHMRRRASMPLARQKSLISTRSRLSAPLPILSKADKGSPRRSEKGTVTIVEDKQKFEPKPGSSKQPTEEEISLLSDDSQKQESKCKKLMNFLLFVWTFIESLMNTATNYLNKFSRDYRYVLRVLTKEKKLLKERTEFSIGKRAGFSMIWEPVGSFQSLIRKSSLGSGVSTGSIETLSTQESFQRALYVERFPTESKTSKEPTSEQVPDPQVPPTDEIIDNMNKESTSPIKIEDEGRRKASVLTVPEIRILAPSLERGLDIPPESPHHFDVMEDYEGAEMSSLDQPPFIRLLHALWFVILSHSDIVCYFMIFLNQVKSATILSLPLPLMVFLWGTLTIPRPSKTFWITIIAYTEIIVLIKCIFQFDILPWNQAAGVPENNPFYAPRILGIERKPQYAVYDLLLLLIVFFHRFMLKTLGLWKTTLDQNSGIISGYYKTEKKDNESLLSSGSQLRFIKTPAKTRYRFLTSDSRPSPVLSKEMEEQYSFLVRGFAHKLFSYERKQKKINAEKEKETKTTQGGLKLHSVTESGFSGGGDDHSDTNNDRSELVHVTATEIEPISNIKQSIKLASCKYTEQYRKFFRQLLDPTSRITADVYAYMFMCDFFNFMVVIFGFAAFGTQQGDGGVSAYLQENKVPIPFLLMLILQFILIIVDRALFLRKYILGKIIFQFLQIIGVHIWMFFVLPGVTERSFNAKLPPQMWYMVKCFYLLLSAYQIRCGYPTRILGNFLCKGYNYVNMILFKLFMMIPFLFELRTIMDWMWTDTSMTIFDWLKMEDIFAHIFQLKCSRHVETEYPQPRGQKKAQSVKYAMGGGFLFFIISIIWFPLVFFALGNTVGHANIPYDVTIKVRIGTYQSIYSMSAQGSSIKAFTEGEYIKVRDSLYKKNRVAQTFLSFYEYNDIASIQLSGNSTMVWTISPPDLDRMLHEVNSTNDIIMRLQYTISRISNNKQESGIVSNEIEYIMAGNANGTISEERMKLIQMLSGNETIPPLLIKNIFPKFVKVTNRATANPVSQLMNEAGDDEIRNSLRNITIKLSHSNSSLEFPTQMWWEVKEDCSDNNYEKYIRYMPHQDCDFLVMYTFNEKSFPASLSWLSGGGIIGLYTTLVFVASRMIRGFFSEICFKIMFDDMPNVDRILQLCLDIYLVREARELCLEEDLFAKLVFLFRSPETLIKWTRPKEDDENEGVDPDEEPQHPAIMQ